MQIIGHRGYRKEHSGNTFEAFQAAIDLGVDGIETDVRVTKDGKLILFHDRYVAQAKVKDMDYSDLSAAVGRRITLAKEALEHFDGILWNLEIKTVAAVDCTLQLLEEFIDKRRLLVTSFWHNAVERIGSAFQVDCGVLISHRPFDVIDFSWFQHRRINTIVWDYEFVDDSTLQRSSSAGMKNVAYKIYTRQEHKNASSRGFSGVITDYPEYLTLP